MNLAQIHSAGFVYKAKYEGETTPGLVKGKVYWYSGYDEDPCRDGKNYIHVFDEHGRGCWYNSSNFKFKNV